MKLKFKKWRIIGEYNKGWRNFMKDQMMQNVLYPQVFTNNLTGEVFNYNLEILMIHIKHILLYIVVRSRICRSFCYI